MRITVVTCIHEAKYFIVISASIMAKISSMHEIIPNSLLQFCHALCPFLDAEDDSLKLVETLK